MKPFFLYSAWGLLALALTLAFPALRLDWAAILLTQVYLGMPRRFSSWLLLLLLALAYSAFSLNSPLAFALPWALAWLLSAALAKSFNGEGGGERAVLLALLCGFSGLGGGWTALVSGRGWPLGLADALWALATWLVGFFGLPLLARFGRSLLRGLALWGPRRSNVDLSRADWIASSRSLRVNRKRFGLEKGL